MSLNKPTVWCQGVVGKHLSFQNNRVSMDENRKVVFIQTNRLFDLSGPFKTGVFIYFKMEHKINKICRNLCTSGKLNIWQLQKMNLFSQYDDHARTKS